jgi:hypothetical protein
VSASLNRRALDGLASSLDEPILTFDGFDDALIGTAEVRCGHSRSTRAVYDRAKCIQVLMDRDGMTHGEAAEYFAFNVEGTIIAGAPIIFSQLP